MSASIGVIDLFAGPGGLGEGFASLGNGKNIPFKIAKSVESDSTAIRTLKLRAFLREYKRQHNKLPHQFVDFHAGLNTEPDWEEVDREAWLAIHDEILPLELGTNLGRDRIDTEIKKIKGEFEETILIGGPPCQAYSIVGRVRSRSNKSYVPEDDERQFLFREYIRVIDKLRPAIFLMENVKGMLSSSIKSRMIFEMLMEDLASLGTRQDHLYDLYSISVSGNKACFKESCKPADYIIRAEDFGIPQRRHRVFIVGIKSELSYQTNNASIEIDNYKRRVIDVIGNLEKLRSGISRGQDSLKGWVEIVKESAKNLSKRNIGNKNSQFQKVLFETIKLKLPETRRSTELPPNYGNSNDELLKWLEHNDLRAIAQHETRSHMASDLERYLFASVFGKVFGYSPKASDFPLELSPNHRSWQSGQFNDRFRVQLADKESTTVTCHLSKDGHYFIHPDPTQCRSLTVREAARLQTFPDDYLFLGNRTQQYVQIGNAVPPYLSRQIAMIISKILEVG